VFASKDTRRSVEKLRLMMQIEIVKIKGFDIYRSMWHHSASVDQRRGFFECM